MESIGKFEFSRKDLIGHGAFAVVFKGRHKEKRDWEVAVKCINKKNLGKSQCLLAKEIKILKELKHENIVRLLDYQETGGCVYLVMEYCNGGDLAEYLHSKGTLSEDTIHVFLQQISRAMKVLHSKGIVHRDLKPQNILLCHPEGRRSSSINTTFKLADFGFARHLQTNTMAATLCGSPMYMAPEVIMSRNYNAKADLWSIGTIVYQSLTGKAPFYASTPHELRLFYESNRNLFPNIPKETSDNLKHLLLGLLQRNHKDRISFEEFFNHPFLETSSSTKKCSSVPVHSYPSSGSGSSSSSSSTSQLASPQHSDGEMHQPQPKLPYTPVQDKPGFLQKETANQDGRYIQSLTEDYVLVPAQFPSEHICEVNVGSPPESSLKDRGSSPLAERGARLTGKTPPRSPMLRSPPKPVSKPAETLGSNFSPSVPIPVPTQIQNYQRMQCVGSHGSTRVTLYCPSSPSSSESPPQYEECGSPSPVFTFNSGGSQPKQSSPPVGTSPKTSEQTLPLSTRTGLLAASPDMQDRPKQQVQPRMPNRTRTVPNLQSLGPTSQANLSRKAAIKKGPFKRSVSTGRLSDMLLKAALGAPLFEEGKDESLSSEKSMEITAPPAGCHGVFQCSDSPVPVIFSMGSPSSGSSPPDTMLMRRFSDTPSYLNSGWHLQRRNRRHSDTETMNVIPPSGLIFHPPELPEDTLMEEAHTDALTDLRFTLAFVQCVMELASSKDPGLEPISSPNVSFLDQSLVADQISLLSREWSYAEQLVLYMKAEEFLSSALRSAKENVKKGELFPSATVKQVIRKLNELYKNCVTYCRSLSDQLQTFLLNKQKLMDNFNALTAEKLIYNHTVHMVKSAALDEMFHHGTTSVQRYHKALVLMEGLSRTLTEQEDIDGIEKCRQCIERRLSTLHTKQYL
ncbi:serine/threonine-protein kinase ULK1a isoform X1 [Haplochromis burtoni]|uniref:serine/threonine-protein kinase ULK1a isoform X1 n=2 Tax=Haplochromis burtoni TaxID=8153 RepID=UPI0003BD24FE|nr:serine/threonine-protein kinase ULK1a isoform X1 [Haplochromis burtoni]